LENKNSKLKIQTGVGKVKSKIENRKIKIELLSTFLIFSFQLNVKLRT
jgi:hypothetical protein